MAERHLTVKILGDSRSLEQAFTRSSKSAGGFAGKLRVSTGTLVKGTVVVEAAAKATELLAEGFRGALDAYKQNTAAAAQTNAVLKSTGEVAGVSAEHVTKLAESLRKQTGIPRAAIQSTENLLLGFTKIRNEAGKGNQIFDQATKLVEDFSVRTGRSATTASIAFGKALNNPVKGMTALSRVGVVFTDSEKKRIKALQESGRLMGAQKIIIGELTKRYGGAAAAAGKTLPGQLRILRGSLEEGAATVLQKVTPALTRFAVFANENLPRAIKAIQNAWEQYGKPTFEAVSEIVRAAAGAAEAFWQHFGGVIKAVVKNDLGAAFTVIKSTLDGIKNVFKLFTDVLHGDWSAAWGDLKHIVRDAMTGVSAVLEGALKNLAVIGKAIGRAIGRGILAGLRGLERLIVAAIKLPINAIIDSINALKIPAIKVDTHIPKIGKISSPSIDPIPHIPRLARGGLVTSPTLALLGEAGAELVLPLNRLLRASTVAPRQLEVAGGGGMTVVMHNPQFNGVTDARKLRDELDKMKMRRSGSRRGPYSGHH